MKILVDTIKKIENILYSLEIILCQEYNNLLNPNNLNTNTDMLNLITKKKILFEKFFLMSENRILLEKKYNIFAPYKKSHELHNCWNNIIKKCLVLRKLNLKNKILINKNFYLNQYFLELLPSNKTHVNYNINGNLEL